MNRFVTESTIRHNRAALVTQRGTAGHHRTVSTSKYDLAYPGLIALCLVGAAVAVLGLVWGATTLFNYLDGGLRTPNEEPISSTQLWTDSKSLGGLRLDSPDNASSFESENSTQPVQVTTEVFVVCDVWQSSDPNVDSLTILTPDRYLASDVYYDISKGHTYRADLMDDTYVATTPQDLGPSTDSEQAECDVWS